MQQQQQVLQQQQRQMQQQQLRQAQQQQRQEQQAMAAMQLQLMRQLETHEQAVQQLLQGVYDEYDIVSGQLVTASTQLSGSTQLSDDQQSAVLAQLQQLHQVQQQLVQKRQQQQLQLSQVRQQKQEVQQQLSRLQQQQPAVPGAAAELGVAAGAPGLLHQQQQWQQQQAAFTSGAGLGAAAGLQSHAGIPLQQGQQQLLPGQGQQLQQGQQQQWSASSILQQMGDIEPIGNMFQPYTSGIGMSLNTQQRPRGQEAAIPVAAVASMFLQLDSKMNSVASMVSSRIGEVEAAVGLTHPQADDQGAAAAAGVAGAVPGAAIPPGSWAAAGSAAMQAAAAAGLAGQAAAAAAAPPAGKKQKQKPLQRAFPTFSSMGTVKGLAKFYFIDPLPESLIALDEQGPTNEHGQPWTPALADAAGLECWRGGRQWLFQRWYEIRFVAAQVTEMVKQLSAKAGTGVLAGVLEAAAALDNERTEMKLTLNKYYHFLKGSRGKGSKAEEEAADGTSEEADEDAS
jgi:hypothetical protein